ncbi:type II toxin-antitoxin system VapC family toxin [Nocardia aurantia]|uniref:Ribonuclease VapC n=1 Tax=Nocardia aurantia TaxID=2585199 RepID=A0A7K0DRX3_9NOCA|nr:type II toxin-antitoxin system VapC family toxin [Nocardia aurantia]MQY28499.1 Ribonuclease VapC35 [Nocardia aurantia]
MLYLDTSALVKLVRLEPETDALRHWLGERPDLPWVASALVEVELVRAVRIAAPGDLVHVPAVLARVDIVEIDGIVRANAAAVSPATVRSLDAIHLATALELATDLTSFVAYDKRLGEAAAAAGLNWAAP